MKKLIYEQEFSEITRGSSKTSDSRYFTTLRIIALYVIHYTVEWFRYVLANKEYPQENYSMRYHSVQDREITSDPGPQNAFYVKFRNLNYQFYTITGNSRIYDHPFTKLCNKLSLDNVKCKFVAYKIQKYGKLV